MHHCQTAVVAGQWTITIPLQSQKSCMGSNVTKAKETPKSVFAPKSTAGKAEISKKIVILDGVTVK